MEALWAVASSPRGRQGSGGWPPRVTPSRGGSGGGWHPNEIIFAAEFRKNTGVAERVGVVRRRSSLFTGRWLKRRQFDTAPGDTPLHQCAPGDTPLHHCALDFRTVSAIATGHELSVELSHKEPDQYEMTRLPCTAEREWLSVPVAVTRMHNSERMSADWCIRARTSCTSSFIELAVSAGGRECQQWCELSTVRSGQRWTALTRTVQDAVAIVNPAADEGLYSSCFRE